MSVFSSLPTLSLAISAPRATDHGKVNQAIDEGKARIWDPDRQQSLVQSADKMSKVFDFLAENDHESDSNGEYTGATLEAGSLSTCAWHL